ACDGSIELPRDCRLEVSANGPRPIVPTEATRFAVEGLETYQLAQSKFGGDALRRGRLSDPLLVQRLDRPNDFYYLIPWENDGCVVGLLDLDARFGAFKSFRVVSQPAEALALYADSTGSREEIRRLLDGKTFTLPRDGRPLKVFRGSYR